MYMYVWYDECKGFLLLLTTQVRVLGKNIAADCCIIYCIVPIMYVCMYVCVCMSTLCLPSTWPDLIFRDLTSDEVRDRERHPHESGGGRPEDPHPGLLHEHQAGQRRHLQPHHRSAAGESIQPDAERCQETQWTAMSERMRWILTDTHTLCFWIELSLVHYM